MATLLRLFLRDIRLLTIIAAFFLLFFTLMLTSPVHAAVFNPGCTAGVGNTAALITAVTTANSNAQPDTINLAAGCTYTLAAQLVISADGGNSVTINGNGATLSGNSVTRILSITAGANVTINSTFFANGAAPEGGAILIDNATLSGTNNNFSNNAATNPISSGGGAIRSMLSNLNITNSVFSSNTAGVLGGAILSNSSTTTVTGGTFIGNSSGSNGGAIYLFQGSLAISNTSFSGNDSNFGGAIIAISGTLGVNNSTFITNTATSSGGGINTSTTSANTTITNSTFSGNTAGTGGGSIYNSGTLTLINSTLSGNSASVMGGGIHNSGTMTVTNSTFSGNSAVMNGGGISHNHPTSPLTLNNTIIANSVSGGDCFRGNGTIHAQNTLIESGLGCVNGTNTDNLTGIDPALGTLTGSPAYFPIGTNSPAINKGNNTLIPMGATTDQRGAGFPRIQGTTVDMGSYERTCVTFPVTIGSSATDDMLFAINCANATPANDVINLRPSVYTLKGEEVNLGSLTINGNAATVDADGLSRVFYVGGLAFINDLTITGGNEIMGGGLVVFGTATVSDSTIIGNMAQYGAGIVVNTPGTLNLINSTISGNIASINGGGIGALGSLNIYNSTIMNNSAVNTGGVLGVIQTLYNSIIANNPGGDCNSVVDARFSLAEIPCTGVVNNVNNNRTGVDPLLSPLTGSPAYYRPLPGSVVINGGNNALIPMGVTQDQAGNARTQNTTVDMGSVETTGASLSVTLTLQSRPPAPNNAYITTVHIQLRLPGSPTAFYSTDYLSNASGVFLIQEMTTGTFDVWIKGSHTLAVLHNVTLTAGGNPLTTALLREGDASDNNQIVLQDFSLLAAAFGTVVGNPGYNPQADFNNDGQVTLPDFSLLASNFNQAGVP